MSIIIVISLAFYLIITILLVYVYTFKLDLFENNVNTCLYARFIWKKERYNKSNITKYKPYIAKTIKILYNKDNLKF